MKQNCLAALLVLMAILLYRSAMGAGTDARLVAGPEARKVDGGVEISFALSGAGDVAVDVLDAKGKVIRHLAAGVLRESVPPAKFYFGGYKSGTYLGPPAPLKVGLQQSILWDLKDDAGVRVSAGRYKISVSVGVKGTLDADWKPAIELNNPGLQAFVSHPLLNVDPVSEEVFVYDELGTKLWKVSQDGSAVHVPAPEDCVASFTYFGRDGLTYRWEIKASPIHEGKKKPSELAVGDASQVTISRFDRQGKPVPFASTGSHVLPICESRVSAGGPAHPLYRGMLVEKDGTISIFRIFHAKQLWKWKNPPENFPCWVEELKIGEPPIMKGWSTKAEDFARYTERETAKRIKVNLAQRPGFVIKDLEISAAPGMDLLTLDRDGRVKHVALVDMGVTKPRLDAKNIPWGFERDSKGYLWVQQCDFSPLGLRKLKLPPSGELLVPEKCEETSYWSLVLGGGDQIYCTCREPVMHQAMDPHNRLYVIKHGTLHDCYGNAAAATVVRDQMGNIITEFGTNMTVQPGVKAGKDGKEAGQHGEFPWSGVALNGDGTRLYVLERFAKRLIRFNISYASQQHSEVDIPGMN